MHSRNILTAVHAVFVFQIAQYPLGGAKKNVQKGRYEGTKCRSGYKTCFLANQHLNTTGEVAKGIKSRCPVVPKQPVECIILDSNDLRHIDTGLIKYFPKTLKYFYCRYCNISNIESGNLFVKVPRLIILDLSYNRLSTEAALNLSTAVEKMMNLTDLHLSANDFAGPLQLNLTLLRKIKYLYLNECSITNITQFLKTKTPNDKLQRLELGGNRLHEDSLLIFHEMGPMYPGLRTINLTHNPIKTVKSHIFSKLPNLQYLRLSKLPLSSAFKGIWSQSLQLLDLSYSLCLYIGENYANIFSNSTKLIYLNLEGVDFNGFKNWTTTDLRNFFAPLRPRLKTLVLAKTSLKEIPEGVFNQFDKLAYLDLSRNGISKWNEQCFQKMPSTFVKLDLSHNNIELITEKSFPLKLLNRLKKLRLHHNNFRCNCSIHWFREWMKGRYEKLDAFPPGEDMSYKCHSPPDLKSTKLVDFDPDYEFCHGQAWSVVVSIIIVCICIIVILVLNVLDESICKTKMKRLRCQD